MGREGAWHGAAAFVPIELASRCLLVDLDDRLALRALKSDLVDLAHEREVRLLARRLDASHHVLGRAGALQLLAVELLRLDDVPLLLCARRDVLRVNVGALAVAPAEARRDLVRAGLGLGLGLG